MAVQAVSSYRESMRKRASTGVLEAWYSRITADDLHDIGRRRCRHKRPHQEEGSLKRASKPTNTSSQDSPTPSKGLPRIVDQPPLLYHVDKQEVSESVIGAFLKQYRETLAEERRMLFDRFKVVDVALKVVGVGSVGTRCFVALLLAAPDDPLFLQVKEARPSVLERYTGTYAVAAQRPTRRGRAAPDAVRERHLPWLVEGPAGRDFYVRQLRDMKIAT